ncbi:MAG: gamma-glutamylcyclotransferase [Verrucomicrobia bacterium]|nr:gamma-glutamylcyclotransferase [Verrucomicrobiota bacterium]
MARRCPRSRPGEVALLDGWRFRINAAGWATVVPAPGARVFGRLWTLDLPDEAALDVYEDLASGLYTKHRLPVRAASGSCRDAMVYLAADATPGTPDARYLEPIVAAAADAGFPAGYVEELRSWGGRS